MFFIKEQSRELFEIILSISLLSIYFLVDILSAWISIVSVLSIPESSLALACINTVTLRFSKGSF
jgi:hypothetical protein